jgi:hypothetical protein
MNPNPNLKSQEVADLDPNTYNNAGMLANL